jgi:sugar O-acyltransferase (sialic acid O-acetyltransferase NeuD family)
VSADVSVPFIIYGAGGHGKVVLDIATRVGIRSCVVVDDQPENTVLAGFKVTCTVDVDWTDMHRFDFLVSIGDNATRERIFLDLRARGGAPRSLIHPFSAISSQAILGQAVLVCAGSIVNPGAILGDNCIVNTSASVDHDCVVGEHSHICPGVRLAGNVSIGARSIIGIGASVLPGVRIGEGCTIGAGSVVNRDMPPHVVAFGVPARIQRELTPRTA